jgi:UDPglucose--hexose-1-phosphate uridylyltransferase
MSEIRQNIITRDWVIFAPERAKRPHEFIDRQVSISLPSYRPDCPFCRGNESLDDTIETLRIGVPDWRVRIVHNKFPALKPKGERSLLRSGIHNSITGFGYHEVIIEHPHHDRHFALFSLDEVELILRAYLERYRALLTDRQIETIVIFKNHGIKAGTSLEHPHSQLAGLPIVPFHFRMRLEVASEYFKENRQCMFCVVLENELEEKERLVLTSGHFIAFVPYAALSPFHIWIFPRRHFSCFSKIEPEELKDLAFVLQQVLAKLYWGLGNPDYNFILRSSPTAETETNYYHWYISIVPRVSRTAGFELGTGMYINTALPDKSAQFLREVEIPTNLE